VSGREELDVEMGTLVDGDKSSPAARISNIAYRARRTCDINRQRKKMLGLGMPGRGPIRCRTPVEGRKGDVPVKGRE
jgi:hypothetical protein